MTDRTVSVSLEAKVSGWVASLNTAKAAWSGFTDGLEKSAAKRKALDDLGKSAAKVGLAATAGLGAAVVSAANFDQAMSHVQAATHVHAKQMDELRASALEWGQKTQYSATEAAQGIEELAKAGVSTKNILAGGLAGSLNLAAAGGLDVGRSAEIAASALTQFNLRGQDVTHVADLLAAAAGKAQGSVEDVGYALKYAGVPAHALGISIEQTVGVLGEFASAGIVGEQAGTNLRSILLSLAAPTKQARQEMKAYGLQLYDSQGHFVGLEKAAQQLHNKLGDATEAERNHALSVIFGHNAIQGAITLYQGGGKAVDSWTKKVNDSGYASKTAAIRMDNLKGDVEQLKGALETALIGTGEDAQGPLRGLTQHITDLVNAYNDLPQPVKDAGLGVTAFFAAAGGGSYVLTHMITGIADMRSTFSTLGGSIASANKWMLAGRTAAGALGVGLIALQSASKHTDRDLAALEDTATGLALGFSAGGPWGAVAGGAAGAIYGLSKAFHQTTNTGYAYTGILKKINDDHVAAAGDAKTYADTLDQETGAITRQTRALILQKAQQAGVVGGAQLLGISTRDLIDATLGHVDAMKRVSAAARDNTDVLHGLQNTKLQDWIQQNNQALRQEQQQFRQNTKDTESWSEALAGIPKAVQTQLKMLNYAPTLGQLETLIDKYHLTPKQVSTLVKALNVDPTKAQFDDLVNHAKTLDAQHPNPKVSVNTAGAMRSIDILRTTLSAIPDQTVYINTVRRMVTGHAGTSAGGSASDLSGLLGGKPKATGGPIVGPGGPTDDMVPIWASHGEHMWTAREVANAGGHAAVEEMRAQFRFAGGGPVGDDGPTGHVRGRGDDEARRDRKDAARDRKIQIKHLQEQETLLSKMLQNQVQAQKTIADHFRTDPFENNYTLQGVLTSLHQDTKSARDFRAAARHAKALGLSGGALRAVLESGDTSVLQDLTTRASVRQLEHAWIARNRATSDLTFGAWASGPYAGDSIKQLRDTVHELKAEIRRMGHHVEKGAERGSQNGTRDGMREHGKHRRNHTRRAARG